MGGDCPRPHVAERGRGRKGHGRTEGDTVRPQDATAGPVRRIIKSADPALTEVCHTPTQLSKGAALCCTSQSYLRDFEHPCCIDVDFYKLRCANGQKVIKIGAMQQTRHDKAILDHLATTGAARIDELSSQLSVSAETIRRALRRLEAGGAVARVHGGVHLRGWGTEASFVQRMVVNPDRKRRIASRLAGLIDNGASLFLDVGSTTAFVAQALRDHRELLVVTNSLSVAQTLGGRGGNRVFMAGGELRPHDGGAFGVEALAFVRQFRVEHAILSAAALDGRTGFMLNDLREAEFCRAIIDCAELATIAADGSKFGTFAPVRVAPPEAFGRLVTDEPPTGALGALLALHKIEVILA